MTHEIVSDVHPLSLGWMREALLLQLHATDVSLSVVDCRGSAGWVRTDPTVQVEGGTFTVAEARRLRQALDDLLARVDPA